MTLEAEVNGQTSPGFRTGWDFPGCVSQDFLFFFFYIFFFSQDFLTLLHSTKNDCQGLGLSSHRESS